MSVVCCLLAVAFWLVHGASCLWLLWVVLNCALFVVCCLLFAARRPRCVVWCSLCDVRVCCVLIVACCLMLVACCCLVSAVCWLLFVVCYCVLVVACCPVCVGCCFIVCCLFWLVC